MDADKAPRPAEQEKRERRLYELPGIHWEEEFLPYVFSTCGKMPGQGGACVGSKKS